VVLPVEDTGQSFSGDVFKVSSIYIYICMYLYKWQIYLQFCVGMCALRCVVRAIMDRPSGLKNLGEWMSTILYW